MNQFLAGAGHFGFGFLIGTVLMLLLITFLKRNLSVQIYSPFLPFVCGFFAALPYVFLLKKTCELPVWSNVFFLYSWSHCNNILISFLGNVHLVGVVCGIIYCLIIWRYIRLVKRIRRYGWSDRGRRHA